MNKDAGNTDTDNNINIMSQPGATPATIYPYIFKLAHVWKLDRTSDGRLYIRTALSCGKVDCLVCHLSLSDVYDAAFATQKKLEVLP